MCAPPSPSLTLAPVCPGALPPAPNPGRKPSFPVLKTLTLPGPRPGCWRRVAVTGAGEGLAAGQAAGRPTSGVGAPASGGGWRASAACSQLWGGGLRRAFGEAGGRGPVLGVTGTVGWRGLQHRPWVQRLLVLRALRAGVPCPVPGLTSHFVSKPARHFPSKRSRS